MGVGGRGEEEERVKGGEAGRGRQRRPARVWVIRTESVDRPQGSEAERNLATTGLLIQQQPFSTAMCLSSPLSTSPSSLQATTFMSHNHHNRPVNRPWLATLAHDVHVLSKPAHARRRRIRSPAPKARNQPFFRSAPSRQPRPDSLLSLSHPARLDELPPCSDPSRRYQRLHPPNNNTQLIRFGRALPALGAL